MSIYGVISFMDDASIFYYYKKENEIERISILMCFFPQLSSWTNKDGTNRSVLLYSNTWLPKAEGFERFQL